MKTKLRANRAGKGTREKVDRIVKELRANPPARHAELSTASGAKIFAIWKESNSRRHA